MVGFAQGRTEASLRVELKSTKNAFELGEPIKLSAIFENIGEEAFFIEKTWDVSKDHLQIVAQSGKCFYELNNVHYNQNISDIRFWHVPLESGDKFEMNLMPINDVRLWSIPLMKIPSPGKYKFSMKYNSKGILKTGAAFPIWRGTVESRSLDIEVLPPDSQRVSLFRERLENCMRQNTCTDGESVQYFKLVRDPQAAELLAKIIRSNPANPLVTQIAEALATQRRAEDAIVLQGVAKDSRLDPASRKFLLNVAEEITAPELCE